MTTIIQAHRRSKAVTHWHNGVELAFKPNDLGHIILAIEDQALADHLLQTPSYYRMYDTQPEPEMSAVITAPSGNIATLDESPYLLMGEDGALLVDLRPMSDDELRVFAKANNIAVHHFSKGDTIRDKIVEALKSEA